MAAAEAYRPAIGLLCSVSRIRPRTFDPSGRRDVPEVPITGRVGTHAIVCPNIPPLKSDEAPSRQRERSGPLCATAPVGAVELAAVNAHLRLLAKASETARARSWVPGTP